MRARVTDELARGQAFVAAEVVGDDDVSGCQRRGQDLFDIGSECLTVDRAIEDAGSVDPVSAQGRDEGQGAPVAVRGTTGQALAERPPAAQGGHVGFHPGPAPDLIRSLVDEDKPLRVNPPLMPSPARAFRGDLRALDLAGQHAFF